MMHRWKGWGAAVMAVLVMAGTADGQDHTDHGDVDDQKGDAPPLYDDLGSYHYEIRTESPKAQAYFDQGLRLYYAFNHAEAIRSFRMAQSIDPRCAMCWWGEALAFGPNINLPMDRDAALAAYAAVEEALELRPYASEREAEMIEALAVRYTAEAPEDRAHLDRAYADAMGALADRYPDDPEIRVLHGEALMDLRPWDYWTVDGVPRDRPWRAWCKDADSSHPGACHFFIHAVEKLFPERAVPCAERLAGMMPGAGHLVHMPGHIYIRVGRYQDAIEANKHAIHADETYIQDQRPGMGVYTAGYYPHNYDFLAFASMMVGRGEDALEAASTVAGLIPEEMFGAPGMDFLQHWSMRPLLFRVRFARWDEILAQPAPPADRPHALALWRYAQGRALVAKGRLTEARAGLDELRALMESGRLEGIRGEFNASQDLMGVGERVLTGYVRMAEGRDDQAIEALREAARLEDALLYGEPPEWTVPTRHDLGEVLMEAGRPEEAEVVFREDLRATAGPSTGWPPHSVPRVGMPRPRPSRPTWRRCGAGRTSACPTS